MKKICTLLLFSAFLISCSKDFELENNPVTNETFSKMAITGCDSIYELTPSMYSGYGITQANPSNTAAEALLNTKGLQDAIDYAKNHGYCAIQLDSLNCFFDVLGSDQVYQATTDGIQLPNGFTFAMTDHTNLRVYQNASPRYGLLNICNKTGVTVTGGHLFGERKVHQFLTAGTHEGGHLLYIQSGRDIKIDGTSCVEANGDGLIIVSSFLAFNPSYINTESHNIQIQNCTFARNRRNNLSVVDGNTIDISYCHFEDAGINLPGSTGTAPRIGIDIEGDRARNANSVMVWNSHPHDITVTNNTETGVNGGLYCSVGDHVTFTGNETSSFIGYKFGDHVSIAHNTIRANSIPSTGTSVGIPIGNGQETPTIHDNTVQFNTIENYSIGISLSYDKTLVLNNTIKNCKWGIQLYGKVNDCDLKDNTIQSFLESAFGIAANATTLHNVNILRNDLLINGNGSKPFYFNLINTYTNPQTDQFTMSENRVSTYNSINEFNTVHGLSLTANKIYCAVVFKNCSNLNVSNNAIVLDPSNTSTGVFVSSTTTGTSSNVIVNYNDIYVKGTTNGNRSCIVVDKVNNANISNNWVMQTYLTAWAVIDILNCSNSTVANNNGSILNLPKLVRGSSCTNTNFSYNGCDTEPINRNLVSLTGGNTLVEFP